jgi:hypothetical protein
MLSHVSPGNYSRAADTRVSDAHTIFFSSSNQIDKPLHAINSLGLLVIFMLVYSYRILSASERHCSDPPPPPEGMGNLPLGEVTVLLLTDPQEVKRELLCLYARIHPHLMLTVPAVARGIVRDPYDDDFLLEELRNRLIHFADQLLNIVYLIRKTCKLYKRLPDDTLEYSMTPFNTSGVPWTYCTIS